MESYNGTILAISMVQLTTLPKTNSSPLKMVVSNRISFSRGPFSGAMLVSGREILMDLPY